MLVLNPLRALCPLKRGLCAAAVMGSVALGMLPCFGIAATDAPEFRESTVRADRMAALGATRAGKRLVIVGERGHILLSDDEGASWRTARSPLQLDLVAVFFLDAKLGWAVGHRGAALRTEDGGETWERAKVQLPENNALLDVWFKNANEGIAIGAYGVIAETSDGGKTWKDRPVFEAEFDRHLYAITTDQAGRMFIAGESGTLLRSDDGGKKWTKLQSPYEGSFFGIIGLKDSQLLAYGMRGSVFRSDDVGATWRKVDISTTVSVQGAGRLGDGMVALVGTDGMILISKDNGVTFEARKNRDRRAIGKVMLGEVGRLLLFGDAGFAWLSAEAWK